mmetsp:Transcript_30074/g.63817  ORF Transcript_30074/g.63817 Transcript_30074/m.63817 type:complete len:86 (+) Transcript_30074:165-422(+)
MHPRRLAPLAQHPSRTGAVINSPRHPPSRSCSHFVAAPLFRRRAGSDTATGGIKEEEDERSGDDEEKKWDGGNEEDERRRQQGQG